MKALIDNVLSSLSL